MGSLNSDGAWQSGQRSILRLAATMAIGLSMTACASINEGAVDYRKAETLKDGITPGRYEPDDDVQKDPIQPLRLIRKDLDSWDDNAALKANDSISINLRQARVQHCFELSNPFDGSKNCEIAVVVHAFEFGKGEDLDFGPEAAKKGRVVYFSSDVEAGQALNMNNLPIYGPITYDGGPIALDISIIEIDNSNAQLKALLKALASAGATAYPPASPVLKVLDQVGTAFLSGNTDDIEFRYTVVLDPEGSSYDKLNYARLEAADYAFVREEDRGAKTDWPSLRMAGNDGRLYQVGEDGSLSEYKDNTYLTIQVNKGKSTATVDLAQNTFGNLRQKLEEVDKQKAALITDATDEVVEKVFKPIVTERQQTQHFDELRGVAFDAREKVGLLELDKEPNVDQTAELLEAHDGLRRVINEIEGAKIAAAERDAPGARPGLPSPRLSGEQISYLLAEVKSIVVKSMTRQEKALSVDELDPLNPFTFKRDQALALVKRVFEPKT